MPEISAGPAQSGLSVQLVEFEPIGSGKNVVHVVVSNPTAVQKVFLVAIQTDGRAELERHYTVAMKAGETRRVRCAFSFVRAIAKDSSVRLRFYEPVSAENCDFSQYFQQRLFSLSDFQLKTPAELKAMPKSDIKAIQVRRVFRSFKQLIRQEQYGKIWDSVFSKDYQDAGFHSLDMFDNAMTGDSISLYYWDRDTLLDMRPVSVGRSSGLIVLSVTNGKETWQISFIPFENGWRIDWISGYDPTILQISLGDDWFSLLLAKTQTLNTEHFKIHYFKNSTAERELNLIAQTKERGYANLIESLGLSGLPSDRKITLVLFEDMKTKCLDTGTVGMGIAGNDEDGNHILLEVYNKKNRLDPYHETTHILMWDYGNPPAIFNEGIAVYMSERLGGAPALGYLGVETRRYTAVSVISSKKVNG